MYRTLQLPNADEDIAIANIVNVDKINENSDSDSTLQ